MKLYKYIDYKQIKLTCNHNVLLKWIDVLHVAQLNKYYRNGGSNFGALKDKERQYETRQKQF